MKSTFLLETPTVMSFRPLSDWLVVKLEEAPERASSGLIVLTHPPLVRKAVVLRVGPGRLHSDGVYTPTQVREGDRVAFLAAVLDNKQGHAIEATMAEGEALIREKDILFVIEEGDATIEK